MKNTKISPVIVWQPAPVKNVEFCEQFTKNVKTSSCFVMKEYCECVGGLSNDRTTYTTTTTGIDHITGRNTHNTSEYTTMSAKECCQCLCLCGVVPLAVQTALLPFTLTWSAADAIKQSSCQKK